MFQRLQSGDPEALRIVRIVIRARIRAGGPLLSRNRKDIEQQTLLNILESGKRATFETDGKFLAFARRVAHCRCIDWQREDPPTVQLDPEAFRFALPRDGLEELEVYSEARQMWFRLKEPCRRIIRYRILEGLSYAEIAAHVKRSEGALRQQYSYCIEQARKIVRRLRRRRSAL